MLNLIDSFQHIRNFPIAKYLIVKSETDLLELSFPYFMKINLAEHKLGLGGVKKCNNIHEAEYNLKEMRKRFPTQSIIIQEAIHGEELVLGIKQDSAFGKLLMLGFGGTNIETIKDITFLTAPSNKAEIETSFKSLKLYPTFMSRKNLAINKFISLAEKVSKLDIKEADFNPVILNEKEAIIVDARISI